MRTALLIVVLLAACAAEVTPDRLQKMTTAEVCYLGLSDTAKRAMAIGYRNVVWYPDGTHGWEDALLTLAACKPEPRPGE